MNVLLSIKPHYANAILSGTKKYEFRKTAFTRSDVEKVYLYANDNIKKIVGSFEIATILKDTPQRIWEECHGHAGISKKDFFTYFNGRQDAFAFKIKNVHKFRHYIDPHSAIEKFTPPQSFYYLPELRISKSEVGRTSKNREPPSV